jgi:aminoglycoside phosphotransferase (APT) family kinase protein
VTSRDLFSRRAGIPEVRWAIRGAAPKRAIRGAIQGLLEDGATVGACRLRRVKFKPGRKLTVTYDAWIRAGIAHVARPVVVVWDRGEGVACGEPQFHELEAEAVCRGLAAPFRRLQTRVPESGASVMVSPLDPKLSQLVRLSDPAYVAAMLAVAPTGASRNPYRVLPIRYRPGERHVLRYEPAQVAPGRAVFAKLSRRDADVARAFRMATHVADCLDALGGTARAVRPLACVEGDGVILFPEVHGRPLSEALRTGDSGVIGHLEAAARALRAIHYAPVWLGEAIAHRDFVTDVEKIRRASEHIMTLRPRTGACIDRTLERARALYDRLPPEPSAFTHGDFKADHLWTSSRRVLLLDFGSCGSGDPALDVGKFLADLDWWSRDPGRRSTIARSAFLAAYGCAADGGWARLQRARVYEALFLVMFAAHRVLLHQSGWAERVARLVRRAAGVLDEL